MWKYLRGTFTKRGLWGWVVFVGGWIYWILDAWGNLNFLQQKLETNSIRLPNMPSLPIPDMILIGSTIVGIFLILWQGYLFGVRRAKIEGEILYIILEDKPDADLLSVGMVTKIATFISLNLQVTNRSPVMVSIIDWSLEVQVGKVKATAKKIDIPPQARRELPTTPIVSREFEPLESLDKKCREEPLKQDVPVRGWLLFELRSVDIPDPRNGRLIVHITDNLSQTHEIIREADLFPLSGKLVWQE